MFFLLSFGSGLKLFNTIFFFFCILLSNYWFRAEAICHVIFFYYFFHQFDKGLNHSAIFSLQIYCSWLKPINTFFLSFSLNCWFRAAVIQCNFFIHLLFFFFAFYFSFKILFQDWSHSTQFFYVFLSFIMIKCWFRTKTIQNDSSFLFFIFSLKVLA